MADDISTASDEVWRNIPGYRGYQVSDHGRVRSCLGRGPRPVLGSTWRLLTVHCPARKHGSYAVVTLGRRTRYVHRLVLLAFVGPCPTGMTCCHYDGDATNNHANNLRWDTPAANAADKVRHGTVACGERQGSSKLTADQVRTIREEYAAGGVGMRELAARYHVTVPLVSLIVNRKRWAHL